MAAPVAPQGAAMPEDSEGVVRLRVAIDLSTDFIALIEREGMRFIDVNETACRTFGYSREEFLALALDDLSPASRQELERLFDQVIGDASRERIQRHTFRRKDGAEIQAELRLRAMRSAGGKWIIVSAGRDIGGWLTPERALRDEEVTFRLMADAMPQMAWVSLADGAVAYINQGWIDYTGLPPERCYGDAWKDVVHPEDRARMLEEWSRCVHSREAFEQECRLQRADGVYRWFLVKGRAKRDRVGHAVKWFGTCTDIDGRKTSEQAVKRQALQQELIARFGHLALASSDVDGLQEQAVAFICKGLDVEFCNVVQIGPQACVLKAGAGWAAEWIGREMAATPSETENQYLLSSGTPVVVGDFAGETRFTPSPLVTAHGIASAVLVLIAGPGGPYGLLGAFSRQPDRFSLQDSDFLQSVANTLEAVVERKNAEDKLARMAQFDTLTGLPNRNLFRDRLGQMLAQAKRGAWSIGVLFVDLDRFKVINDTLGHDAGDELLRQVAGRLQSCLRSGDTLARLSGDEFAVVLSNLAQPPDAGLVAQKIVAAFGAPFDLGGKQTDVSASIGVALYPTDGTDPDSLLKNADIAMYRAKEHGRGRYQFYLPEMQERALARMQLEAELRGALKRGEFVLHYQPKADLYTGGICGLEALLRWNHPERGIVAPLEFIAILEETGLIVPVGEWVLRTACAQIAQWQKAGQPRLPVAVNISARQFQLKDLDTLVRAIVAESGVDPRLLELELTESLLVQNPEQTATVLRRLKSFGVRISVDDFGTGYSSLAYLKRFPLDALKIDRAFIRDCISDPDDAMIASAIINLARSLKLKVVGEGVETVEQLNFLRAQGCDEIQGYYLARPMAASAMEAALASEIRLPTRALHDLGEAPALLLVDDNPDDLEIFREALQPEGYRVLVARNAQAALDILARTDVGVVISDQNMPGTSGIKFLATLRNLYPEVVRAMLTGSHSHTALPDAVNQAGVHKFLSKHWDTSRLQFEVREAYKASFKMRARRD